MRKKLLLLALIVASIPAFVGIFHPGFFATDDGNWMIIRLSAFYEALRQGQFPVRFLPRLNNGFGYPVADFLYPLFLYIGSLIHAIHIPFVMTIKILFGVSLLSGTVGSFFWLKKKFGDIAAVVGALIYTLFPYHMWDITKRGSLGEVLALGIVPFIFWQIEGGNNALTGLGIGLLVLAHNTLALLFLPVILGYFLLLRKYKEGVVSLILGLGMAAFFWFPALFDKQFTVFDTTAVSHFSQYFLTSNLYPLIGLLSFVVILLSLSLLFKKQESSPSFFLVVTLLAISLTAQVSTPIWQLFHLGTYVQFPFRFLSLTALGISFLSAYVIRNWKKQQQIIVAGLLIILLYMSSWQYFFPKTYQYYPDTFYSTNQDSTTVQNEYMPIWVKHLPQTQQKITVGNGTMQNVLDKGSTVTFDVHASQSGKATVALVYFPGWSAVVDGRQVHITPQKISGFITFPVPQGMHHLTVRFGETPVRMFADLVSLLTLFFFLAFVVIPVFRLKKK